ncbi:MAG: DEAD/DEAH box helicase [Firmicutes bacterium]|nr:DEAD/DEAH box helicase [Bacillota bacterium]
MEEKLAQLIKNNVDLNNLEQGLFASSKQTVFLTGLSEIALVLLGFEKPTAICVSGKDEKDFFMEVLSSFGKRVVDVGASHLGSPGSCGCPTPTVLHQVSNSEFDFLIIEAKDFKPTFPSRKEIESKTLTFEKNKKYDFFGLAKQLVAMGFVKREHAQDAGDFSVLGDTVMIKQFDGQVVKLSFFGDELENIKTNEKKDLVKILGSCGCPTPTDENVGVSHLGNPKPIFSLLDESVPICIVNPKRMMETLRADEELKKHVAVLEKYENPKVAFQSMLTSNPFFASDKFYEPRWQTTNFGGLTSDRLAIETKTLLEENYKVVVLFANKDVMKNVGGALNVGVAPESDPSVAGSSQVEPLHCVPQNVSMEIGNLNNSIIMPTEKLAIISHKPLVKIKKSLLDKMNASEFKEGSFVVHAFYGVARFKGITKIEKPDSSKDYLELEYGGGDKVFVPAENAGLVSEYRGSDKAPRLHKLSTKEYEKIKKRVRESVKELAFDLIKLYKEREKQKGFVFNDECEVSEFFHEGFGFELTEGQKEAYEDIKKDMEMGKPVDRLICGDVGYGKTELALRAAFKAIKSGKQVALLAPTTILTFQHYNTALKRMKNFGIEVRLLNRFKTKKEREVILGELKDGKVNLIIGTHSLLSKEVKFFDLGLLILDEEQRFGVGHKEQIKNLKKSVAVLTLTATPLPRTLHLSLISVRDISVLDTPPPGRLAPIVKVSKYDIKEVISAIHKEHQRNGQTLIIFNNTEKISAFCAGLQQAYENTYGEDNIRFEAVHAKMPVNSIENKVLRMYNREIDVLVSTTLIENGIDLPEANTLIVYEAQNFGLSQLYQLKGRVGRSTKQAYAYFTFKNANSLTEEAIKRLEAIKEFSDLGSGYKIAMRDLELRGAGNILGAEQSGHMEQVGYDEYVKILNDCVLEAKGEKVREQKEIILGFNIKAEIADSFEKDTANRIKIYKKFSEISNVLEYGEKLKELETEYKRSVPEEIRTLAKLAWLKNLGVEAGVAKITTTPKEIFLSFYKEDFNLSPHFSKTINKFQEPATLMMSKDIMVRISTDANQLDTAIKFLTELNKNN